MKVRRWSIPIVIALWLHAALLQFEGFVPQAPQPRTQSSLIRVGFIVPETIARATRARVKQAESQPQAAPPPPAQSQTQATRTIRPLRRRSVRPKRKQRRTPTQKTPSHIPQTPKALPSLEALSKVTQLPSMGSQQKPSSLTSRTTLQVPKGLTKNEDGTYEQSLGPVKASISSDGDVKFSHSSLSLTSPISSTFDMTDELMRSVGEDPYLARKSNFLKRTADFRLRLKRLAFLENLASAKKDIFRRLRNIWGRGSLPPEQRKLKLFKIWDGVYQGHDQVRREGGEYVRKAVLQFIRRRIPPSSPHHYTFDELQALAGKQRSKGIFRPYPAKKP